MSREKGVHWAVALNSLLVPDPESFSFTSTESEPANVYLVCLVMGCHVFVCLGDICKQKTYFYVLIYFSK